MDNRICNVLECSNSPQYLCKSRGFQLSSCEEHVRSFVDANNTRKFTLISKNMFDKELSLLYKTQTKLELANSMLEEECLSIRRYESPSDCSSIYSCTQSARRLLEIVRKAIENNIPLSLSSEDFLSEINIIKSIKDQQDTRLCQIIINAINTPKLSLRSLKHEEERYNYYFDHDGRTYYITDNRHLTHEKKAIENITTRMGYTSGVCALENRDIFCCSGVSCHFILTCYRINPWTQEYQRLADLPYPNRNIIPLKKNDSIYIFGGHHMKPLSAVIKYSLSKNKWKQLSDLPVPSHNISSVAISDSFLVYGNCTRGVYSYNQTSSKLVLECNQGLGVILKNDEGQIFLLSNGTIFSSHENDFMNWNSIGSYDKDILKYNLVTSPQQYNDYFCLRMCSRHYLCFRYRELTLQEIPKID